VRLFVCVLVCLLINASALIRVTRCVLLWMSNWVGDTMPASDANFRSISTANKWQGQGRTSLLGAHCALLEAWLGQVRESSRASSLSWFEWLHRPILHSTAKAHLLPALLPLLLLILCCMCRVPAGLQAAW